MATNDGGTAFPSHVTTNSKGVDVVAWKKGMTLRDYFAGQALVGQLAGRAPNVAVDAGVAATCAYIFADAMLAAREAKP